MTLYDDERGRVEFTASERWEQRFVPTLRLGACLE